jgi:5-carboxyvanillate decarboxylase
MNTSSPAKVDGATGRVARGQAAAAAGGVDAGGNAPTQRSSFPSHLRKIATEEAFTTPEIAEAIRAAVCHGGTNLDLKLLAQIYDAPPTTLSAEENENIPIADRDRRSATRLAWLLDLDRLRLADMDANGVDMHVLSLTARLANDRLADAVRRHPTRFAGLASFAPQDPAAAAKEMQRAITELKLNGFLVNSHTDNGYLDEERFWPILEAAEALDVPLYLHPRAPSEGMAAPFRDYRIEGAVWGYGVETGTHLVRLIFGGVLDRFPRLRIVVGHLGEALPFWLWRLDFMGQPRARAGRKNELKPSEYFQRNIAVTTSGVEDPLALRFCIEKIGVENVMWAIDYPYQPTSPCVAFIENAPLSAAERNLVAHGNAERIFKIAPAPMNVAGDATAVRAAS